MSDLPDEPTGFVSVGAAQGYVEGEFGGPVTETDIAKSMTAGDIIKLVDNNPDRLGLTIINLGASDAYIAFSNKPSSSFGLYLAQSGGFFSIDVRNDQMLPCREWYGIAPTADTTLYLIEIFRYALT